MTSVCGVVVSTSTLILLTWKPAISVLSTDTSGSSNAEVGICFSFPSLSTSVTVTDVAPVNMAVKLITVVLSSGMLIVFDALPSESLGSDTPFSVNVSREIGCPFSDLISVLGISCSPS